MRRCEGVSRAHAATRRIDKEFNLESDSDDYEDDDDDDDEVGDKVSFGSFELVAEAEIESAPARGA